MLHYKGRKIASVNDGEPSFLFRRGYFILPPVSASPPSQFRAFVDNARGRVDVTLITYQGLKKLSLEITWKTPYKEADSFSWTVERIGTKEQLADFIVEWTPKLPDPELVFEGLAQLSAKVPEGVL
jgi:hypothetical protein